MLQLFRAGRRLAPALALSLLALPFCRPAGPGGRPLAAGPEGFPAPVASAAGVGAAAEPGAWSAPAVPPEPVSVLYKSPVSSAQGQATIQVKFNQPMVKLGRVKSRAEDPARYPIAISPPVTAEHRWVGGDVLKVALTKPLQNATRYEVRLLASLRSVAGTGLARPVAWRFETPRPRVTFLRTEATTRVRASHLHPRDRFRAGVNLHARPEDLAQVLALRVNGKPWPVQVALDPKQPHEHVITPGRPLPLGARILLTAQKGLRSTEGALRGDEATAVRAQVYTPLKARVFCGGEVKSSDHLCWPMAHSWRNHGLRIGFTEPVTRQELLARLRVSPPIRDLTRRLVPASHDCSLKVPKGRPRQPCASTWAISGDLVAATRYVVRVDGALTDVWGQRLGAPKEASFRTRDFPPGLHLPGGGEAFREPWHPWQFKVTNARQVDVRLHAFTGPDLVRFLTCLRRREDDWHKKCLAGRPPVERALRLGAKVNVTQSATVALPPGLVALQLASPQVLGPDGDLVWFRQLAIQTDLGLHVRVTPYGLTAWVTSLRTGLAVPGVKVTVYDPTGRARGAGTTDGQGLLHLARADLPGVLKDQGPPAVAVVAEKGRDVAYTTPGADLVGRGDHRTGDYFAGRDEVSDGSSGAWRGDRPVFVGHVSTERGIYRPGHVVHLHGVLRRFVAWRGAPAPGRTVTLELADGNGLVLGTARVRTSDHGIFLARLPLPAVGQLGYHRVRLKLGKRTLATHSFRVAEYKPPRFTADVRLAPRPVLADGELRVSLAGRYLFGGAMGGAGYKLRLSRSARQMTWKRWKGYFAGAYYWNLGQETVTWHRSEGVLDGQGKRLVRLPLRSQAQAPVPWPTYQSAEVEIRSAARRTVADWHGVMQLPGERLVAIKALDARLDTLRYHLRVVDPSGRPQRGKVAVQLLATRRKGWRTEILWDQVQARETVTVGPAGATLAFRWPKGYKTPRGFLLLTVTDARGREARTGQQVRRPTRAVLEAERRSRVQQQKRAELALTLDRDEYLPGQTALVTITRGPAVRSATLFVERERIFRRLALRFGPGGRVQVKLPVLAAYAGAVSLRVVGVRSGRALRGEKGPILVASETLTVSDKPFRLAVALKTDQPVYRPGAKVKVSLQVTDGLKRPRPAGVVLMAVDEAVLNLTHYHLPDPYRDLAFTPGRSVRVEDLRRFLVKLGVEVSHVDHRSRSGYGFGSAGFGMGGGGSGGGGLGGRGFGGSKKKQAKPRKNFRTTAWHIAVVTDKKGRATATFTLPDNLTAYRIMAFAVDKERSAGTGRTSFRVDQPLLTLPALPRLLREGDRASAGVVLYNAASPAGPATVTASVKGAAVTLEGPTTKTVQLAKGAGTEVRFGLRANKKGTALLTFRVEQAGGADALEVPLAVTRPVLPEAASVSGETRKAVRHGVEPLSGLRADFGGLEVSLASTALTGVEDGMEQLLEYPYGCLEQTASRLLPLLAAAVLGDRFAIKLPRKPGPMIRLGLQRIFAMQRHDGGFGYWPSSSHSWAWATAYALVVFHRAQRAAQVSGVPVPRHVIQRAVRYLRREADHRAGLGRYWFAYEVFLRYALALHGSVAPKPVLALHALRRRQPLFARALLLATLAKLKTTPAVAKARAILADELGDALKVDGTTAHAEEGLHVGYQVFMHSDDRTTAMVLHALLLAKPDHPMLSRLVRWFLQGRKQAKFRNTQEAAWALMAMWDFAEIREREVPDFEAGIWLGTRQVVRARFQGRSSRPVLRRIPMADLMKIAGRAARDLTVAKRGKGILYYVARLRYARIALPSKPRDHGFEVRKQIQVLDNAGRPLATPRPPRLGDTLLVTLRVTTREARRYVVVDDPLPAGLESIDTTLATAGGQDAAALGAFSTSYYNHRELRDDRAVFFRNFAQPGTLTFRYLVRVTTAGDFLAPPTRAEEMYNPEIFGYTASGRAQYPPK